MPPFYTLKQPHQRLLGLRGFVRTYGKWSKAGCYRPIICKNTEGGNCTLQRVRRAFKLNVYACAMIDVS